MRERKMSDAVTRLEGALYHQASSREEYADLSKLEKRLGDVFRKLVQRSRQQQAAAAAATVPPQAPAAQAPQPAGPQREARAPGGGGVPEEGIAPSSGPYLGAEQGPVADDPGGGPHAFPGLRSPSPTPSILSLGRATLASAQGAAGDSRPAGTEPAAPGGSDDLTASGGQTARPWASERPASTAAVPLAAGASAPTGAVPLAAGASAPTGAVPLVAGPGVPPSAAPSTAPGASLGSGAASAQQMQYLQYQTRFLILLRHASGCRAPPGECQQGPRCATAKALWLHLRECQDKACRYSHCRQGRSLLKHHQYCRDERCPICAPARRAQAQTKGQTGPHEGPGGREDGSAAESAPAVSHTEPGAHAPGQGGVGAGSRAATPGQPGGQHPLPYTPGGQGTLPSLATMGFFSQQAPGPSLAYQTRGPGALPPPAMGGMDQHLFPAQGGYPPDGLPQHPGSAGDFHLGYGPPGVYGASARPGQQIGAAPDRAAYPFVGQHPGPFPATQSGSHASDVAQFVPSGAAGFGDYGAPANHDSSAVPAYRVGAPPGASYAGAAGAVLGGVAPHGAAEGYPPSQASQYVGAAGQGLVGAPGYAGGAGFPPGAAGDGQANAYRASIGYQQTGVQLGYPHGPPYETKAGASLSPSPYDGGAALPPQGAAEQGISAASSQLAGPPAQGRQPQHAFPQPATSHSAWDQAQAFGQRERQQGQAPLGYPGQHGQAAAQLGYPGQHGQAQARLGYAEQHGQAHLGYPGQPGHAQLGYAGQHGQVQLGYPSAGAYPLPAGYGTGSLTATQLPYESGQMAARLTGPGGGQDRAFPGSQGYGQESTAGNAYHVSQPDLPVLVKQEPSGSAGHPSGTASGRASVAGERVDAGHAAGARQGDARGDGRSGPAAGDPSRAVASVAASTATAPAPARSAASAAASAAAGAAADAGPPVARSKRPRRYAQDAYGTSLVEFFSEAEISTHLRRLQVGEESDRKEGAGGAVAAGHAGKVQRGGKAAGGRRSGGLRAPSAKGGSGTRAGSPSPAAGSAGGHERGGPGLYGHDPGAAAASVPASARASDVLASLGGWQGAAAGEGLPVDAYSSAAGGAAEGVDESTCCSCGRGRLTFEPPSLYCFRCAARIKRNQVFWCTPRGREPRGHWCHGCYSEAKGDTLPLDGGVARRSDLEKRKNDEETEEGWVACDRCERWVHQVCGMFNKGRNEESKGFHCPQCLLDGLASGERRVPSERPQSMLSAKDLPVCGLSRALERRLQDLCEAEDAAREAAARAQQRQAQQHGAPGPAGRPSAGGANGLAGVSVKLEVGRAARGAGARVASKGGPAVAADSAGGPARSAVAPSDSGGRSSAPTPPAPPAGEGGADGGGGNPRQLTPKISPLTVRVVDNVSKRSETLPRFARAFAPLGAPASRELCQKVLLLFQLLDGVDVCIFCMYVQEYDERSAAPNARTAYLSYLDSVKYFSPEVPSATRPGVALRTAVYHEILVGYLQYLKERGFVQLYLWACPPLAGDDYILYCHPNRQRTPRSDRLREWYLSALRDARARGVVAYVSNLYDTFFDGGRDHRLETPSILHVPYFDGDYWPGEAENILASLEGSGGGAASKVTAGGAASAASGGGGGSGAGAGLPAYGGASSAPATTKRGSKASKAAAAKHLPSGPAGLDVLLVQKLGEAIQGMREDFLVVHLRECCSNCRSWIDGDVRYVHPNPPGRVVVKSERTFDGIALDRPGAEASRTVTLTRFQLCRDCYNAEATPGLVGSGLDGPSGSLLPARTFSSSSALGAPPPAVRRGLPPGVQLRDLVPHPCDRIPSHVRDSVPERESEFFDSRQAFLSLCQGNHYQFDTLRRAKHSSMMLLYHLHNPTAPAFACTCNLCGREIVDGDGFRCDTCPDFDVCGPCRRRDPKGVHEHALTPHARTVDETQERLTDAARADRDARSARSVEILVHSCACDDDACPIGACRQSKVLLDHALGCTNSPPAGNCPRCAKLWGLINIHASHCHLKDCPVPMCEIIRVRARSAAERREEARRNAYRSMLEVQRGQATPV